MERSQTTKMCLVLSLVSLALAYNLLEAGNMQGAIISLLIALFFIILLIRNILKTKTQKRGKDSEKKNK
ncbi:MAG: hypothetical protein ACNI25_11615 [Halarcobacter sp.]